MRGRNTPYTALFRHYMKGTLHIPRDEGTTANKGKPDDPDPDPDSVVQNISFIKLKVNSLLMVHLTDG